MVLLMQNQAPEVEETSALITPAEAARKLGVTVRTVANLADAGKLEARRIGQGHRRYDRAEVEALAESSGQ